MDKTKTENQQAHTHIVLNNKGQPIHVYSRKRTIDESIPFIGTYIFHRLNEKCVISHTYSITPPISLRRILIARQNVKDITEVLLYYSSVKDNENKPYIDLRDLLNASVFNPEDYFLVNFRRSGAFRINNLVLEKTRFKQGDEIVFIGKLDHIRIYKSSDLYK